MRGKVDRCLVYNTYPMMYESCLLHLRGPLYITTTGKVVPRPQ